jgi:outer membrane receptor protein involved in Fe transport
LLALGAVVGGAAFAQSSSTVTVTGTRIKSLDVTSNSPILSIGFDDIKTTQPVVIEEFFKGLPSAIPGVGANTNNGNGGGATIDLRGLGANRTLVLIDGRRVTPFDLTGRVDTNVIPLTLLQRVELVTGGASTVHGADAVAGVVNFIMRKDFNGFEAAATYGTSEEGDGNRKKTDFTFGSSFDKGRGNVALSFGTSVVDSVRQDQRPIGLVSRSSVTGNPQGSGTTVPVNIIGYRQINPATGAFGPVTSFNFNPDNYYQTGLDRTQFTALGNYVINDHAEVYSHLLFSQTTVATQLAPSGSFFGDFFLPLGNPYLPAPARQALCDGEGLTAAQCADNTFEVLIAPGRRFVEFGPRLNDFKNSMNQWTLGVRGALWGNWSYDLYTSTGKSDQLQTRGNWGSSAKVQQALRALDRNTCIDPSNGCVPLNLFGAAGSITPAMVAFINLNAVLTQKVEQRVHFANISGDLGGLKSPFSRLPVSVAFGAEKRTVEAANASDGPSQAGDVLGTGAASPDRSGKLSLKEGFAELIVPLVTGKPVAEKLNIELGYRYTEFSTTTSRNYDTFKYGGEWEPFKGLRFRAMKQRATRAPNVDELFLPVITQLDNLDTDPCQGTLINQAQANTPGTLSNLCRLTGVPLNQIGRLPEPSAGQINVLTGGNPNLGPEKGDTLTVGLVFQPQFAKGLAVSVDYWKIKINEQISQPAVDDVLEGCYDTRFNPQLTFNAACALVGRSPSNGTFNGAAPGVFLGLSNLGKIETAGWDLGISYSLPLKDIGLSPNLGRVDLSLLASVIDKYNFQPTPTSVVRNCVGYYSVACGTVSEGEGPINKTKWNLRANWAVGDWNSSLVWRRLSKVIEEPGGTNFLERYSTIKAYDYLDLGLTWNFSKNLTLNLSVTNLLDKAAPEVGNTIGTTGANSGNTFPQTYDPLGRYWTLGVNLKF